MTGLGVGAGVATGATAPAHETTVLVPEVVGVAAIAVASVGFDLVTAAETLAW